LRLRPATVQRLTILLQSYIFPPRFIRLFETAMELFRESSIDGEFRGWRAEARFSLANGEVWQQVSPEYKYYYRHNPPVRIFKGRLRHLMEVQGMDGQVEVRRILPEE